MSCNLQATCFRFAMTRSSRPAANRRSACPIACALDLIGDRWTLLVIRDLLTGKTRYGEFQASPEGIPTNILAERLKRIEDAGLVEAKAYQQNPVRYAYTLTPKGQELKPVVASLAQWGRRHVPAAKANAAIEAVLRS